MRSPILKVDSVLLYLFILKSVCFSEISCESSLTTLTVIDELVTRTSTTAISPVLLIPSTTISPSMTSMIVSINNPTSTDQTTSMTVQTTRDPLVTQTPVAPETDAVPTTTTDVSETTDEKVPTTSEADENDLKTTAVTNDGGQLLNLDIPTDLFSLIAIVLSCASFCCMLVMCVGCLLTRQKRHRRDRAHIQEEAARVATLQRPLGAAIRDSFSMTFENPMLKETTLPTIAETKESSLSPHTNPNKRKYSTAW